MSGPSDPAVALPLPGAAVGGDHTETPGCLRVSVMVLAEGR